MGPAKQRKIKNVCCAFNEDWTHRYFSVLQGIRQCVYAAVSVLKKYNLKRHHQTNHAVFGSEMSQD